MAESGAKRGVRSRSRYEGEWDMLCKVHRVPRTWAIGASGNWEAAIGRAPEIPKCRVKCLDLRWRFAFPANSFGDFAKRIHRNAPSDRLWIRRFLVRPQEGQSETPPSPWVTGGVSVSGKDVSVVSQVATWTRRPLAHGHSPVAVKPKCQLAQRHERSGSHPRFPVWTPLVVPPCCSMTVRAGSARGACSLCCNGNRPTAGGASTLPHYRAHSVPSCEPATRSWRGSIRWSGSILRIGRRPSACAPMPPCGPCGIWEACGRWPARSAAVYRARSAMPCTGPSPPVG